MVQPSVAAALVSPENGLVGHRCNYFRDNWGKFKVTSVKINSWGSIYVNLRLIDGEYYNRPLINEFTEQKTQYKTIC